MLSQIIIHTPVYVFVLLAFFIYRGISSMRDRVLQPTPLIAVALIFAAMGLQGALSRSSDSILPMLVWTAMVLITFPIGYLSISKSAVSGSREAPMQRGSIVPLLLILAIFASRYVLGAMSAMHPEMMDTLNARLIASILYGATPGLMIGRVTRVMSLFLRLPGHAQGLATAP